MLSKKITEGLQAQINKEMGSAYIYLAISAQCSDMNWPGFARWFMVQYHEEMFHSMKLYNYLLDSGVKPELTALAAPRTSFSSVKEMFETTYAHEQGVTKSIWNLMALAKEEKDYATEGLLTWYVKEQVEEEKNDTEILAWLERIGESAGGLFQLDHKLGKRGAGVPTDFTTLSGEDGS